VTQPLWTSNELQQIFHSNTAPKDYWQATGISIDSRTLKKGDLFVALKGPLADGHDHVVHAAKQGAAGAIVERVMDNLPLFPQIVVPDAFQALQQLALAARKRAQNTQVIGLTGSFGKTSSREALRHILSLQGPTYATERNFNNHWGVPLSVARLHPSNRFAVFEMGMNHAGEITPLSQIVQPHVGLITTIGNAHIGNFGSLDGIADAKAEIFAGMAPGSIAVLNRDNPQYSRIAAAAKARTLKILSFGTDPAADCRLLSYHFAHNQLDIKADIAGISVHFQMNVLGDHWASNMVGVLACIHALGLDVKQAAQALTTFTPIDGRGAVIPITWQDQQITVIDDTYNGGPQAMRAAFQALRRLTPHNQGRRIAVLGEMADLGDYMIAEHQALAEPIKQNNIDLVLLYGPYMKHLYELLPPGLRGGHFDTVPALTASLLQQVRDGDCILVKGARGHRAYDGIMYQVVLTLRALADQPLQQLSI
jgi:UDP-N-acetylmuramoyl-tripeptide--D-alanyl-D-alanine ligase